MYSNKRRSFPVKSIVISLAIIFAILFDLIFSFSSLPVLTIIVCGIVVIYECVSPFIYTAR